MEEIDNVPVFSISTIEIQKTLQSQCKNHKFERLSKSEVKCTVCPTALIVGDAELFLTNLTK